MPRNAWKRHGVRDEQGTILVVTVVAMLILGILAISFAALGNLEVRIGMNDVWDKQAGLVAEGGISAVRNQIQTPPDYTAFLDGRVYSCTTSSCSCSTGCAIAGLATMAPGEFSVLIDNDPADPGGAAVDTNARVRLTALGITRGATGNVMGRSRIQAWITNDDPWDHVCASGDGVLCTDPPNNPNAEIDPRDPNDQTGPRTYPQIPVPNQIRTTPCYGCAVSVAAPSYPVPTGQTIPGPPYGPNVMYPYYLTALTTACTQCDPATIAYDPANPTCTNAATSAQCLGLVRLDASINLQTGPGGSAPKIRIPGGTLGAIGNGVTLYILGTVAVKGGIDFIYGTIVFHGDGVGGTGDLDFQGPHTVTAAGPACSTCSYPLIILGYNPNEGAPPSQTMSINISNNNVILTGVVYTGGSVDLGPNTVNGSILGYQVNANNGATEYTYVANEPLPPPGFSTPSVTLPSVVARGTWIQCRTADNLTDPCD